jgi:hypothetical protein
MNKPEQRFPVNTRVKLRDGVDPSLYGGFSRVGNEGWIRKRKRDKYGYPQVLIEWDKDHWAYNGQQDGWTWEGQFQAVEEKEMADATPNNLEEQVKGITDTFVKSLVTALNPQSEPPADEPDEGDEPESEGSSEEWDSLISQAQESIGKAPAYLLVALEYAETPNAPPMIVPRVFHAAREPEHALVIQSQLAHLTASFQDATIAKILEHKARAQANEG